MDNEQDVAPEGATVETPFGTARVRHDPFSAERLQADYPSLVERLGDNGAADVVKLMKAVYNERMEAFVEALGREASTR